VAEEKERRGKHTIFQSLVERQTHNLPRFLLRSDRILPGDVLLTRGGLKSLPIAAAGGGYYGETGFSHAAVFINSVMIFESDGGIIGFKTFLPVGWVTEGTVEVALSEIYRGKPLTAAAVYRHKRSGEVVDRFEDAFNEEMEDSFGKDYSALYRLLGASRVPSSLVQPFAALVRSLEVFRQNRISGPFCSELVARIYQRMQIPLFESDKRAENVSPNHLAVSNLELVSEAVADSKSNSGSKLLATFEKDEESEVQGLADEISETSAEIARGQRGIEQQFKTLDTILQQVRQENSKEIGAVFIKQLAQLKLIVNSSNGGPHAARASKLLADALKLWPEVMKMANQEQLSKQDHRRILEQFRQFNRSFLRVIVLFGSASIKEKLKKTSWLAPHRQLSLRFRRWRSLRDSRRILNDLKHSHFSS